MLDWRRPVLAGCLPLAMTGLLLCQTAPGIAAQDVAQESRDLNGAQNAELRRLSSLVNRVVTNDLPGGDAWLKWEGHFLRAQDGRTYVPFTLTIAESPGGFESVSLYIRVIAAKDVKAHEDTWRKEVSAFALYNPEAEITSRREQGDFEVASANAANARAIEASVTRRVLKRAFEDGHFLKTTPLPGTDDRIVRRALVLDPGDYVVYAAVQEYPVASGGRGEEPKWAVLKRRLTVPDLSGDGLTTSSILLTERVVPVSHPLSEVEQAERPYALGAAEVTPVRDTIFRTNESLSLLLFAYDLAVAGGKPDVTVRYRFFRSDFAVAERLIVETAPQELNEATLPEAFTVAPVGGQLPIDASIPLASFMPGLYRLEIQVSDNIAGTSVTRDVKFTMVDGEP